MMNLTRRGFLGVSTVVAGLGLTACNNSEKKADSDNDGKKDAADTNSVETVGASEELVKAAKEEGKTGSIWLLRRGVLKCGVQQLQEVVRH